MHENVQFQPYFFFEKFSVVYPVPHAGEGLKCPSLDPTPFGAQALLPLAPCSGPIHHQAGDNFRPPNISTA